MIEVHFINFTSLGLLKALPQMLKITTINIFFCSNLPLPLTPCSPKHNVVNRVVFNNYISFFFRFAIKKCNFGKLKISLQK